MAQWNYAKLGLITTFGRQSQRPHRSAIWKVTALTAFVLGMTYLWMPALRQFPLAPGVPGLWWLAVVAVGIQLLSAVTVTLAQTVIPSRTSFVRLLVTLPIHPASRWVVLNAPSLILSLLVFVMLAQPLWLVAGKTDLPAWQVFGSSVVGMISGIGLASYRTGLGLPARLGVAGVLGFGEILILKRVADFEAVWLAVLLLIPIVWLYLSIMHGLVDAQKEQSRHSWLVPYRSEELWYMAKFLRHRRTFLAFLVTFLFGALLAGSILYRPQLASINGPLLLITAILVSTFASDARGITRRLSPPEIVGGFGSTRMVSQQILTTTALALAATGPIWLAGTHASTEPLSFLSRILAAIIFSSSVGLLVSEIFVATVRDISGQLLGALCCVGLILVLPKFVPVENEIYVHTLLAVVLFAGCFMIERLRNNYVWKVS